MQAHFVAHFLDPTPLYEWVNAAYRETLEVARRTPFLQALAGYVLLRVRQGLRIYCSDFVFSFFYSVLVITITPSPYLWTRERHHRMCLEKTLHFSFRILCIMSIFGGANY